jgi:hypothetical protein
MHVTLNSDSEQRVRRELERGASFMHMRNGKLHDGWNFFDFTAVVQQLRQ